MARESLFDRRSAAGSRSSASSASSASMRAAAPPASVRRISLSAIAAGAAIGLIALMTLVLVALPGVRAMDPVAKPMKPAHPEGEVADVARALVEPGPVVTDATRGREDAVSSLVGSATMSRDEAERTVAQWERIYSASGAPPVAAVERYGALPVEEERRPIPWSAIWGSIALLGAAAVFSLAGALRGQRPPTRYSMA